MNKKGIEAFVEKNWIPFALFIFLMAQGASLGLSDDEAYYWVLAQKPAFSYAFHPPAVAWFIAFVQFLFGWLAGTHSVFLVRLPSALTSAAILYLTLNWMQEAGLKDKWKNRAAAILLSFSGFFSLSWMMVPDIPLFLGWTLLFIGTWEVCYRQKDSSYLVLGLGACIAMLSKYSGVLAVFSSFASLLLWARGLKRTRGLTALFFGFSIAVIPILIWNAQHEWGSILYQIHDRHGSANFSLIRFARFLGVEVLFAGAIPVVYSFYLAARGLETRKSGTSESSRYLAAWIIPPMLVFCLQPLFFDFKPHWAFIVWWPVFLGLGLQSGTASWKWIKYQVGYGAFLGVFIVLACHFPIGGSVVRVFSGKGFDPRLDVSNDLYGWRDLGAFLKSELGVDASSLPVIGSRYQTAAQASFSLGKGARVTLLPRDKKEWDEWPNLDIASTEGSEKPSLHVPALFVTDIRFDAPPDFRKTICNKLGRMETSRYGLLAKWIDVWRCDPRPGAAR